MSGSRKMDRLLRPRSIAVVGGGAWCEAVIAQNEKIGFDGDIWPVHPSRSEVGGKKAVRDVADLPSSPDAVFVGVNRHATVQVVGNLSKLGAGGAVCFASGFAETDDGAELSDQLLSAAGQMPVLGPNCYGALNLLDRVALWPDQHGAKPTERGVAIVAQSSNIAINLTMQKRGLPIAYVVTAGNQLQMGLADIANELLLDTRVTALGLYIESFGDVRAFEALAAKAAELGKGIVALKVGRSVEAKLAAVSHTASIAGGAAGSDAFLNRLGIANVTSLAAMLETLKIYHCLGPLGGNKIASLSCSGGEASVMADTADVHNLRFPPLQQSQLDALGEHLGPLVTLTNPLDYHTDIWRNKPAMTAVFAEMSVRADLTIIVLDFPRTDVCSIDDWLITLDAIEAAVSLTGKRYAVLASTVENMPEEIADRLLAAGIVPLCDFDQALAAVSASQTRPNRSEPVLIAKTLGVVTSLTEGEAKAVLARHGVDIPKGFAGVPSSDLAETSLRLSFPLVLKGEGAEHKSEAGFVALGLTSVKEVTEASGKMACMSFALDEMITGAVAELMVGIVSDPAVGFIMTLAAGGIHTEILNDQTSLLIPATKEEVANALEKLRCNALMDGYRGKPPANREAVIDAIMAVQSYVTQNSDTLAEVEINPLMCTPTRAVAVDALIVKEKK